MILLCTSAAMPTADRLYRNFVAAKMVHLLVDRSWTQLPHPFQSTVKKVRGYALYYEGTS